MSDTCRIIDLLPWLAELHLQQRLSSVWWYLMEMSVLPGVGGMEGWAQALLCSVHPLQRGASPAAAAEGSEGQGVDNSAFIPCQTPALVLSAVSSLCKGGRRAKRRSSAHERRLQTGPCGYPKKLSLPWELGWCSQAITHFSLDCPAGGFACGMNYARIVCVKHQKCWGWRRGLSVYELACG